MPTDDEILAENRRILEGMIGFPRTAATILRAGAAQSNALGPYHQMAGQTAYAPGHAPRASAWRRRQWIWSAPLFLLMAGLNYSLGLHFWSTLGVSLAVGLANVLGYVQGRLQE